MKGHNVSYHTIMDDHVGGVKDNANNKVSCHTCCFFSQSKFKERES